MGRIFMAYDPELEGDELFQQIRMETEAYEVARKQASHAEDDKTLAKTRVNDKLAVLLVTTGRDPADLEGVILTAPDGAGKQKVWQRTHSNGRKTISAQKLLEAGVSAAIIERCTDVGAGSDSWSVSEVKAETLAKKVTEAALS